MSDDDDERQKPWSRPRLPRGHVRMIYTHSRGHGAAKFHVPAAIARLVSPDAVFRAEATEDGILFRYVEGQKPPKPPELPRWMTGQKHTKEEKP